MPALRAVVDSTRLEDKVGDFLLRSGGAEPAESDSDAEGMETDGRVLCCDSCMCFVFEGLSYEYLEPTSRSAANLQVFLFLVQVFSFFKIRTGMMFEDVRVRKSDSTHGDYRHAEPSDALLELMRGVPIAESADANLKYYLLHHAQKKGEYSCGMRAWIFLPTNINLAAVVLQFLTQEVHSRQYREQNKCIPAKIAEISSVKTLARVMSMACGDMEFGGRGAEIAQRHTEFGGEVDQKAVQALDPRVHFNACTQIRETADILTSNTDNDVNAAAMAALMRTDPAEYGTLVDSCDGTVEEEGGGGGEESDDGGDVEVDDGGPPPPPGGRARVGGVSDQQRGFSRVGISRVLPDSVTKPKTPTRPKSGTLCTPRGVRIIGLAYECMATLLAQGNILPFGITPSEQFYMQYISGEDLDARIPIYFGATPVHQRGDVLEQSAAREQKEAHAARHAACAALETVATTRVIPGSGEQRAKKRRGIDAQASRTDIEVETDTIRAKIDRTVTWCAESPLSPFASSSDAETNCLLSELLEMIKLGMLHHFFAVYFSPQSHACDFTFKIQEHFEEHITVEKWRGRQLSDYRRDTAACVMDPYTMCATTQMFHSLLESFDLVDRLHDTHSLQLSMWCTTFGAAMPSEGGHRKCLHNKKFAGPRDCSKTYNMQSVQSKLVPETFLLVHHQTAAYATGTAVDHNDNECSAQQHKTAFEDEAGVKQLGMSETGGGAARYTKSHDQDEQLNKRKELLGNSDTIVSHRAYTDENNQVRIVSKKHSTVGATITGTNSSARSDPAIASRYTQYNLSGRSDGMKARGGITKRQVMASTDEDSVKTGERKAYQKARFQTPSAIVALCMQMRHAGLLDFGAQDKMTRDVLVEVMRDLDECNDTRELYKVQGFADVLAVLIRVVGMFHVEGLLSVGVELTEVEVEVASEQGHTHSKRFDHSVDTAQPYPVGFAIFQTMRRMMAPSPAFALYAIGDTVGVVHSDITEKLLLVKLAAICGLRHFDYKAAKRQPGGKALLDGYARELNWVREDVLAGDPAGGDLMAREAYSLEYLDTKLSYDEMVTQLKAPGMSTQIVQQALEDMGNASVVEVRRPNKDDQDWDEDALNTRGVHGPKRNAVWKVWSGTLGRPDQELPILKYTKARKVLVAAGAVLQAVEAMEISSVTRARLGAAGKQQMMKLYSDWGQGVAKQDEVRRAMARAMPQGLPKYASWLDGTLPITQRAGKDAETWYETPNVCCFDAMPAPAAAAAAAGAPDGTASALGFHTVTNVTAMDGVLGATRSQRLGFVAPAAGASGLCSDYKLARLTDANYTSLLTRTAYTVNGCYHSLRETDGKVALMFPAPAACIAAVSGQHPERYLARPSAADTAYKAIYPDCFINGNDSHLRDVGDSRIGAGCCPVGVAKARPQRGLGLEDEWCVD
jgi:hypothetical protein